MVVPVSSIAVSGVPECPRGHVLVTVSRGPRVARVCPECLSAAVRAARPHGQPLVTVNDYLASLERSGEPPQLSPGDAGRASQLHVAAAELYPDEPGHAGCRRVVRDVARAVHVAAREVMAWPIEKLPAGLQALRRELAA